ncbi:hypothetical protein NP233_g9018 [Leucocoprinus birnbaumii]|uniref:CAMK/RAD53 protein kinase n=1 Tax=Leucocoprinus birnbaumii TaxID=56174 RepID=A0AAD5VLI4_9AGAR|nr:hypothetical protein NP233_g9018 [Leucocoprinus birnbaumii]
MIPIHSIQPGSDPHLLMAGRPDKDIIRHRHPLPVPSPNLRQGLNRVMTTTDIFHGLKKPVLIMDGGLGTTLEETCRTQIAATTLWSAEALKKEPEAIVAAHLAFLRAGAEIIETSTYQCSFRTFERAGYDNGEAWQLMRKSVLLAHEARTIFEEERRTNVDGSGPCDGSRIRVCLSLGPFGASLKPTQEFEGFYPPPYGPQEYSADRSNTNYIDNEQLEEEAIQALADFHWERLSLFAQDSEIWSLIDMIAFETVPLAREAVSIRRTMARLQEGTVDVGKQWWISFVFPEGRCPQAKDGTGARLGTSDLVWAVLSPSAINESGGKTLPVPSGIGINCSGINYLPQLVEEMESVLRKGARDVKPFLVLYPNGGGEYDQVNGAWKESVSEKAKNEWAITLMDLVNRTMNSPDHPEMNNYHNEDSMDFDEEPLQETQQTQEPQTQSTQDSSQQQNDLESHLWGALIPCNPQIARVDLWKIQKSYRVGRHPTDSQIVFPGPKISNHHCDIVWDGNDSHDAVVTVHDKSSNGTWIGGSKIGKHCTRVLREGNEIGFGSSQQQADGNQDYRFIFRMLAGAPATDGVHAFYDVTHELGKGSFATVMKAVERCSGRWYAIKIITEKHNRPTEQNRVAFDREINIMKQLKHPNICELKEVFYQESGINLVLELVEGGDLLEYIIRQGGLSEDISRRITYQICDALSYIHSQGITHRDLKPENVLLTKDDPPRVKVADFGLAKAVVGDETMLRTMCGTPTYLAPEVVIQREGGGYTNRVDSWSVGVIVFSMLTNASPFIEDDRERDIRIKISTRRVGLGAINFIQCLLEEDPEIRMSLTQALNHPWLRTRTAFNDLQAYDTVSSMDPHDFSMLSSMPGFDPNASVTTNLNGLHLNGNYGAGPSAAPVTSFDSYEEQSWERDPDDVASEGTTAVDAESVAVTPATNKKRVHAELTPQDGEDDSMGLVEDHHDNVGAGRMTRARARAQQQPQPVVEQEDSFEVPGLTSTRRGGPPNKMARRK